MDTDTAVMVRDLRKSYPDVTAVDGIDLDIARGEVFALLGPNGAGKTTTVEILEGFRQRDRGTVAVLGHDPAQGGRAHGGRAWRARIGIVLQLATTGPELTVMEMVRHFASFYPCPREPEEAAAPAELASAVRAAARGETVLAPSVAERLVTHVRRPQAESLSARETEVLARVARGRTNAEIGRELFISEATVKTHLLRAFGKLGVSGRTAAVTVAIERGLLPPPGQ